MTPDSPFDLDLFERVLELDLGISQPDNAQLFKLLDTVHPVEVEKHPTGIEHNGWVVPPEWHVERAEVRHDGDHLFDGTVHPLAIARHSCSFQGTLTRDELDDHVFCNRDNPEAYGFHSAFSYRPWTDNWGLCPPYDEYRTWPDDGRFEVKLVTEEREGTMRVGRIEHPGERESTVLFQAHTCHPCQANDDMAGVMVVLALFDWLSDMETRWTYRALLAPEHLGTVFHVRDLPEEDLERLKLGCFVEMVGTETPFALQRSFTGDTLIDRVAEHVLAEVEDEDDLTVGPFSRVVGNDEAVWEAPGIEVPMVSISRWPYPEYHSSADDMDIISTARLEEALDVLKRIVLALERDVRVERRFDGFIALSNPKYDLYKEFDDPVVDKDLGDLDLRFAAMQDSLPRFFDGRFTCFDIAEHYGVPFEALREYLDEWADKELVELTPRDDLTAPPPEIPERAPGRVET